MPLNDLDVTDCGVFIAVGDWMSTILVFTHGVALVKPRLHNTTCCQTGLTNGYIVYTAVVKPVVQPD